MLSDFLTVLLTQNEIEQINAMIANYNTAIVLAIVFGIGFGVVSGCWVVYEHWFTPLESKELRITFRKKRPLVVLGGDDGFADFKNGWHSGPEGIIETKSKGRTQEHYTGALPRPYKYTEKDLATVGMDEAKKSTEGKNLTEDEKKKLKNTIATANYLNDLANRRLLLRGSRVPVWFAYRGKAILTSLYWLVAIQILDNIDKLTGMKDAFATVDLVAIKSLFPLRNWNQSQIQAQEVDKERKGELKAKKFAGKESLIMVFAIMIVFIVVLILAMVIAYYFA